MRFVEDSRLAHRQVLVSIEVWKLSRSKGCSSIFRPAETGVIL